MPEAFTTLGQTTLAAAITSTSATTFTVSSGTSFPSSGTFRVRIDNEIFKVTSNSSGTFTVVRADGGTTAATHLLGAVVTLILTAEALYAFQADTLGLASQGSLPGGRLTLSSGVPVTITDITAQPTVYYTPYVSNVIALWDGAYWQRIVFTELSLALGTVTSGLPYDVFLYSSAGVAVMEKLAWTSALVPATDISIQDGHYCKTGDKTRLYVGSFIPSSTTTTEDSEAKPFLYNHYHRIPRRHRTSATVSSNLTTSSTSYSVVNSALDASIFVGTPQVVDVSVSLPTTNNTGSYALDAWLGLRVDGSTDYDMLYFPNDSNPQTGAKVGRRGIPLTRGLHSLSMLWRIGGGTGSLDYRGADRPADPTTTNISCVVVR